jgi:hypothetical protein
MELLFEQEGVKVYRLDVDGSVPLPSLSDLLFEGRCAGIGVYYHAHDYPRFRAALSDNLLASSFSDAQGLIHELMMFLRDNASAISKVQSVLLFSHQFKSDTEFKFWELQNIAAPFMSEACGFEVTPGEVESIAAYHQARKDFEDWGK